jgi:hypothetical protein
LAVVISPTHTNKTTISYGKLPKVLLLADRFVVINDALLIG